MDSDTSEDLNEKLDEKNLSYLRSEKSKGLFCNLKSKFMTKIKNLVNISVVWNVVTMLVS